MKIIHCADLHLDSQMTANLTKEQARERKREIIRTFTRMVEYAEKTGVRLIMISGDLFDTRNVSALARNTVRDMICTHPQIDFLYLRGNHDSDNFLSKLEEVPDNLLLFSDTWTAYRYGNIVISGIELSENNRATVYNSLVLGHEDFNIVMMHGQAGDYACRTQAENISLNQLKNKILIIWRWDMYIPSCRTSWITAVPGVTVDVWKDADLTSVDRKDLFYWMWTSRPAVPRCSLFRWQPARCTRLKWM